MNEKALLLEANETQHLPCKLEPTQVISIRVTQEKEMLLPKFAVQGFNL